MNSFIGDSNVVELSSTELNEIVGGGLFKWLLQAIDDICEVLDPTRWF